MLSALGYFACLAVPALRANRTQDEHAAHEAAEG
jgi:hypothetical protein